MEEDQHTPTHGTEKIGKVACDACRGRKVKCDRLAEPDGPVTSNDRPRCTSCETRDIDCTYIYKVKRRGPPPGQVRRMTTSIGYSGQTPDRIVIGDPPVQTGSPEVRMGLMPERFVEFLPRTLLNTVVDLFLESVYPLLPYPHTPSFLQDLESRRETHPGHEEWTTMVVSVVGFTLVQVPNRLTGHSREQVRRLVEQCFEYCRAFLEVPYKNVSVDRSVIYTCNGLVALDLGFTLISREMHGSNVALMLLLGLNRRQTYDQMGSLEREMKLRAWWLVYTADRSSACIEDHQPLLIEDMCDTVDLPAQIDDEYLSGSPDQVSKDQTPVVSGFHYSCRLWRMTGHVLHARLAAQDHPPVGPDLHFRVHQVEEFLRQVDESMVDSPEELRLYYQHLGDSPDISSLLTRSMDPHSAHTLPMLLSDVPPSTDDGFPRERLFNIMKANIYITQQALLFMGLRYRDELLAKGDGDHPSESEQHRAWQRSSRRWRSDTDSRNEKSAVLMDLLKIMGTLPVNAISVNTLPCLTKIRYVASELLTELESPCLVLDPISGVVSPVNGHNRAIEYLSKYISLLSEIESLYALVEE